MLFFSILVFAASGRAHSENRESYSDLEVSAFMAGEEKADRIWAKKKAKYGGDTPQARAETLVEIRGLDGVKAAGLNTQGSIWIEYKSGLKGGLTLPASQNSESDDDEEESAGGYSGFTQW